MSKKANPTLVGAFILSAVFLTVGAVIVFGSTKLFSQRDSYLLYFDDSVNGLEYGSPVKFKGVKIGEVKSIMLSYHQAADDTAIPVIIEIDNTAIESNRIGNEPSVFSPGQIQASIKNGLRGKLETESFVTGRLYVALDFFSDTPDPVYRAKDPEIPEIPTQQSPISKVVRSLSDVDWEGMAESLRSILEKVDTNMAESLKSILAKVDTIEISKIGQSVDETLEYIRSTANEIKTLVTSIEGEIDPLSDKAQQLLAESDVALKNMSLMTMELRNVVAPESRLYVELTEAMKDFSSAARWVGELAEFLSKNPKALISGKKLPEER